MLAVGPVFQAGQDLRKVELRDITPTPLGEGKSTTTMGLTQGLGKRGKNVIAA
ncbi:MAG: formate--tetrahydrofolate ligase, partial [Nitrospirota bacterium]